MLEGVVKLELKEPLKVIMDISDIESMPKLNERGGSTNELSDSSQAIAPAFDLNTIPRCAIPMKQEVCKKTGFALRRRGNITLETRLQKSGFVPGEIIYAECFVNNESSKKVFRASAELFQCAEFIAYEGGCGSATFHNHRYVGTHEQKSSTSTISCLNQSINIPPKSKGSFVIKLPVKATVSSFNCCPITKVDYYLKVKIESETSVSNTIKTRFPVILGTIPVRSQALTLAPLVMPAKEDDSSSSATNPTAPPEYPQPTPQPTNLPDLPPPSYEQAVYGDTRPKSDELDGFLPRYPVYPNLDSYLGTNNATKEEDLPSVSTIKL
ncbi:hypothetical protein WR25_09701 [Diploscapter pachys]|uniref:Arrestin C-terminal-like domain-containing protein n=1 Tax=Diploscapter pachys TaxID=2018661 RepID=A0A2A2KRH2_9BILA|nr:hypothetical protein WR25_09701 [Diploscapter pachys]